MEKEIIWLDRAKEELLEINEFLLENWGFEIADKFVDKVLEAIDMLLKMPKLGKVYSPIPSIRQWLISPHTIIYYIFTKDSIIIVNIGDTRKHN